MAVTGEPLDLAALAAAVRDPRAGAVVCFEGVTREVPQLEYEAYAEMAEERLHAIAAEEAERHGLCAVGSSTAPGRSPLGEPSVIVAASAPHRGEAFAGARAVIDRVKAEAPIWKVERPRPARDESRDPAAIPAREAKSGPILDRVWCIMGVDPSNPTG